MTRLRQSLMIAAALFAAPIALAPTAYAKNTQKYKSTMVGPVQSVQVEVKVGDDLAYRANHLSKDIKDRSVQSGLNNGFSGAGFYGDKDIETLRTRIADKTETQLMKYGVTIDEHAPTVLTITSIDARPNRPTFMQLSKSPSLSMRSFGLGGAEMQGHLSKGDQDLGNSSYGWYESSIEDAYASSTWSDANRAINRFARETAKNLSSGEKNLSPVNTSIH